MCVTDGKSALSISASHFNKVASTAYEEISDECKQHLMESSGPRIQQMSRKSIMKCGEKAFKNIQKEVYTWYAWFVGILIIILLL